MGSKTFEGVWFVVYWHDHRLLIGSNGTDIYWPKLDDGLYLPDFLEHRWHPRHENLAA